MKSLLFALLLSLAPPVRGPVVCVIEVAVERPIELEPREFKDNVLSEDDRWHRG